MAYAVAVRVAWFSPVPPVQSGISAYTAEILPRLAQHHRIDLVLDEATWRAWAPVTALGPGHAGPAARVVGHTDAAAFETVHPFGLDIAAYRAHDFLFLHDRAPYDVIVYQLGNATCHDYMWPYLVRFPGLVVFHDGHVHHARARSLLSQGRRDDYRAEFTWAHPGAPRAAAEYAVGGMTGASYYFFPWLRPIAVRARAMAAHTRALCSTLAEVSGRGDARLIRMGVADLAPPPPAVAPPAPTPRSATLEERASVAVSDGHARATPPSQPVTLAAFGLITEEKRIVPLLRAFAAVRDACGEARLRLVGARAPHFDVDRTIDDLHLREAVEVTGYVSDGQLAAHLSSADVCLCLRWPTTGETSASWLRCLAAARTTVITDLLHTVDVPSIDPRSWTSADGGHATADASGRLVRREPVCVAIDILDEEHSLRLALPRLCTDAALRARIGAAARAWWAEHHTLDVMEQDYLAALEQTVQAPVPDVPRDYPEHLLADGTARARHILAELGVTADPW